MVRQLVLDNAVLILQYSVSSLLPLLLVPHIVKQVGLANFGALGIALAAASFGSVVVQYAFQLTGPRQLKVPAPGDTPVLVMGRIFSAKAVLLALVWMVVAIGVGVANWAGHAVTGPQLLLLLALPLATACHTGWHLQAEGRFATVSLLAIVGAAAALAIGFGGVQPDTGFPLVFLAAIALAAAPMWTGVATLVASVVHLSRSAPQQPLRWQRPWDELRQGFPLCASQFAAAMYGASGPLVIGWLATVEEAGAYTAIERVSGAVVSALLLTHTAAYPRLVQLYATDRAAYRRLLLLVMAVYGAVVGVLATAVGWMWGDVLQFLLGNQGAAHGPLLASALLWVALGIFGPLLTGFLAASARQAEVLPLTVKVLAVALLLGLPGVQLWGAWAWLAALCASQIIVVMAAARAWAVDGRTGSSQATTK